MVWGLVFCSLKKNNIHLILLSLTLHIKSLQGSLLSQLNCFAVQVHFPLYHLEIVLELQHAADLKYHEAEALGICFNSENKVQS